MKKQKFVEVTWIDAADGEKNYEDLPKIVPTDELVSRTTYGKLYKEDENAIIIITTEDHLGLEYVALPKVCITEIKQRRKKSGRNKNKKINRNR